MPEKTNTKEATEQYTKKYEHPKTTRVDRLKRAEKAQSVQANLLNNLLHRKNEKEREKGDATSKFKDVAEQVINKFQNSFARVQEESKKQYDKNMDPNYSPKDAIKDAGAGAWQDFKKSFREIGSMTKLLGGYALGKTVEHLKHNKEKFAENMDYGQMQKTSFADKLKSAKERGKVFIDKFKDKVNDYNGIGSQKLQNAKTVGQKAYQKGKDAVRDPYSALNKVLNKFDDKVLAATQDQIKKGQNSFNPEAPLKNGFWRNMANAARVYGGFKLGQKVADHQHDRNEKVQAHTNELNNKRIELGRVNDQGFMCIKDDNTPGGFRFEAVRDTKLPTGTDKDGKQTYMNFKSGESTGVIIPKGRKQKEEFAQLTHGDQPINLAIDHDSKLTIDKHSKQSIKDIMQTKGAIQNSEVNVTRDGSLNKSMDIENSTVNVTDNATSPVIKQAGVESLGNVDNVNIQNTTDFYNNGHIQNSNFNKTHVYNPQGVPIKDSQFENSRLNYENAKDPNLQINTVKGKHATVYNSLLYDSNLDHGTYDNSYVNQTNADLTNNSYVSNSNMNKVQVKREDLNAGKLVAENSQINRSTIGLSAYNDQHLDTSVVDNAVMVGKNDLNKASIESKKSSFIRNFSASKFVADLHNKAVKFTEKHLINNRTHSITDDNVPNNLVMNDVDQQAVASNTGVEHPINDVQTDEGKISAMDRLKILSRSVMQPGQMEDVKFKDMFDRHPDHTEEIQQSTPASSEPDITDEM